MENNNYNSLTNNLIKNGILSSNDIQPSSNFFQDYKEIELEEKPVTLPFINSKSNRKRLNKNDLELVKSYSEIFPTEKNVNFINKLFAKFFPKLYKAAQVKKAIQRIKSLNISEQNLFNKIIPYGENEERYKDIIKYLNCANEIQNSIK